MAVAQLGSMWNLRTSFFAGRQYIRAGLVDHFKTSVSDVFGRLNSENVDTLKSSLGTKLITDPVAQTAAALNVTFDDYR